MLFLRLSVFSPSRLGNDSPVSWGWMSWNQTVILRFIADVGEC